MVDRRSGHRENGPYGRRRDGRVCGGACALSDHSALDSPARRRGWNSHSRRHGLASAVRKRQSDRSEEHTSELQSLMRISYAVFCLKKKKTKYTDTKADKT